MPVRVLLFGPPRLDAATGAPLARARGRALLAFLCLAAGRNHPVSPSRDALVALLWPDYDPDDARNNLRRELSLIRAAIGDDLILADRVHAGLDSAALADGRLWVDAVAFERLVTEAEAHRHPAGALCDACAAGLAEAEALYSADFLDGFSLPDSPPFDEWQRAVAQRLRAVVDGLRARLTARALARGEEDRALALALRRLAADPLNEAAHRDRLRALALAGQTSAVLREHDAFARLAAAELGAPLEPATLALVEDVRRGRPAPVARSSQIAPPAHNLPAQATPFVGREAELSILSRLFADPATRLVTLVGPGGMGKTRLALAWAEAQTTAPDDPARVADGIVFVDLAPVTAVDGLLPALADALRFPLQSGARDPRPPLRQLVDYLADRRMLLLIDNAEHLTDAAPLLVELLTAAPGVRLLVTSRERLNVRPEQVYPLDGLAFPAGAADHADYAAALLFVTAARRARPDFALTPADPAHLAEICRLVGGMPLALEMAAAWVDALSPAEIAAELGRGVGLLETDLRDVPARQRSVRVVIDYAWQRLAETDRRVLARLSVFRGGMAPDAVAIVAHSGPRQLATLVRRGLLHVSPAGDRYRLHELLRQDAAARLDEDPVAAADARDRHAGHYAHLLARAAPRLSRDADQATLAALDIDSDNIDAAVDRLLATRAAGPLLGALNGLCLFHDFRLRLRDGYDMCGRVLDAFALPDDGGEPETRPYGGDESRLLIARALNWRVYFHLNLSDERASVPVALAHARALLETLPDPPGDDLALNLYLAGDPGVAMDYTDAHVAAFAAAGRAFEQAGNNWGMVNAWQRLFHGYALGNHTRPDDTRPAAERALAFALTLGNRRWRAELISALLQYALHLDDRALVAPLVAEMDKDLREPETGDATQEATWRGYYAWPLRQLGRTQESYDVLQRWLSMRQEYGLPPSVHNIHQLGRLLCHLGRYDEAAEQFRRGLALARAVDNVWVEWLIDILNSQRLAALGELAAAEALLREALTLTPPDLAEGDMAGHWANLGLVVGRQGRWAEARPMLARGLRLAVRVYNYLPIIEVLPGIALALAATGSPQTTRAAELYGLLMAQPYYATARHFQDMSGRPLAEVLRVLPPDVAAAAEARGRSLPLWPAAEQLLADIEALGWGD